MKLRLKTAAAGAAALALVGTALVATAGSASAYTGNPPWVAGDTQLQGGLLLFNSAGQQKTGGATWQSLTDVAYLGVTGTSARLNTTAGAINMYFPQSSTAIPANWLSAPIQPATPYTTTVLTSNPPIAGVTGNATAKAQISKTNAGGTNLWGTSPTPISDAWSNNATPDNSTGYQNVFELRFIDSGAGVTGATKYWAVDIEFNPAAAGGATVDGLAPQAWKVVYPAAQGVATTTTAGFTYTPASPAALDTNSAVTLTAAVSPAAAAGTVQFQIDSGNVGSPVTVASGAASLAGQAFTAAAAPGHTITAIFTPTAVANLAGYAGSTGSTTSGAVVQVAGATSVAVTGPASATVGLPASYIVAVNSGGAAVPSGAGSVAFSVNGVVKQTVNVTGAALTFSYVPVTADVTSATAPIVAPLAVTASFTSTSALYASIGGNTVSTTVTAPAYIPDPQDVTVNVPAGTLVISTPYTALHPLNLGTMTLSADGTGYTASAPFGDPAAAAIALNPSNWNLDTGAPTTNGVTVTDTRANGSGWNISVLANDFTGPASKTISGNNLTFTNITPKYIVGNALQSGVTAPAAGVTAFGPGSGGKTFASLAPVAPATSTGTVAITAVLGLTAPTSTAAGQYTATITFSIV